MRTFIFSSKNSSVTITLSADNFEKAEETLFEHVQPHTSWSIDDVKGEKE